MLGALSESLSVLDDDVAILFGGVGTAGLIGNALNQIDFAVYISGQSYVVHQ